MTADQKALVQGSFAKIAPIADVAAELFYGRLFTLDPSLRKMFRGDMKEQGRKLMHMLALTVKGLDNPEQLLPAVRLLGERHAAYGVLDEHYDTVGTALLWTLAQGLDSAFTPDVEEAWTTVYSMLAHQMKAGATACV